MTGRVDWFSAALNLITLIFHFVTKALNYIVPYTSWGKLELAWLHQQIWALVTVLIIVDNGLFALELESWLKDMGYKVLQPIVSSSTFAFDVIHRLQPNMVLIDIHLEAREASFGIARHLTSTEIPYILVTQDERVETFDLAKKFLPSGYLVKPFSKQRLHRTIELALVHAQKDSERTAASFYGKSRNGQLIKVSLAKLAYVEAIGNYCYLNVTDQRFSLRSSLRKFVEQLPADQFIQIHRRYIVAISRIDNLHIAGDRVVVDGVELPVGGKFKQEVVRRIRCK